MHFNSLFSHKVFQNDKQWASLLENGAYGFEPGYGPGILSGTLPGEAYGCNIYNDRLQNI